MNHIRSLLRTAARRIELASFLARLHWVLIVASVAGLLLVIADRLPAESFTPWVWVIPALAVVTLVLAVIWWLPSRRTELQVAVSVDERLDLREKLSTALHCERRDDAFAQAAVEDAVQAARDQRTRERTRRLFAFKAPPGWWLSPLIVFLAIMASFLHQFDVFAREQPDDPMIQEASHEAQESLQAVRAAVESSETLSREMSDLLEELTKESPDATAPSTPEQVKRDAIKRVNDFRRKVEDILGGEKAKSAETLRKMLGKLNPPEDGPAKDLANALAKGDFVAASKALKELTDKINSGQMNKEDQEKLAEQMQQIASQLQQLAQQQQQLEQALQQAGMNPQLAQNPQALQQAIQNNQNLNQQQKQQLQQMAKAQQQACQACQGLGQAMQNMAQAAQNGQMGQAGQGAQQQLNQLEMAQQLLRQAQAAANACQGQCNKLGQGLGMQKTGGMGDWGQGRGGTGPIQRTPTGGRLEKADAPLTEGDVIASQFFDGPQIKGESVAAFRQVVAEAAKGFDEGQAEEAIHKRYEKVHQHYFGELQKLTEAVKNGGGAKATESDEDADSPPPSEEPPPDEENKDEDGS
ncbi:MAG: hypothetical protein JSV91_15005 [Phycisphaerales bacterium]|nr:MAG: hypothetical protein JSV91_15005 [Phycisphaerales bacterium]